MNLGEMRVSRDRLHGKRAEESPSSISLNPNASYMAFEVLKEHQAVIAINASAQSARRVHQDIPISGKVDLLPLIFPERVKPERIVLSNAEDGALQS